MMLVRDIKDYTELATYALNSLLTLDKPEILDESVTITVDQETNYDYVGQVTGRVSVASPTEYKIAMYTYTTGEYAQGESALNESGEFNFKRTWPGTKQFRLIRIADGKWISTLEFPLCIRSYHMPENADPETIRIMKDRCYTYDQAVAALALMVYGHEKVEQFVKGLLALVNEDGGVKFYVNRLSAKSSRNYYRMGNVAWVLYALAFYLEKFPAGNLAAQVREKLTLSLTWLETYKVTQETDRRKGLYLGGKGRFVTTESGERVFEEDYVAPFAALEHQVDIWFLFELLGRVGFDAYQQKAADFGNRIVEAFWMEDEGRFRQGVRETEDDNAAALDQSSWGGLFAAKFKPEYAERCHAFMEKFRSETSECRGYTPYKTEFGYPNAKEGVWVEGAAGVALFERQLGNDKRAVEIINDLDVLLSEYGYRDSCDDPTYDTLPPWWSTTNTAWVLLVCKPSNFWLVDKSPLTERYNPQNKFLPDISLNSLNLVISLVNHDLKTDYTESDVEISKISLSTEENRDTTAIMEIRRPNKRSLQIYYNRLTAERWLNQQPILVKVTGNGFTTRDLIDGINAVCGSNLQADDLTDKTFTVGRDAVTLQVSPNSLGYKGQFSVLVFGNDEEAAVTKDNDLIVTADNRVLTFGGH